MPRQVTPGRTAERRTLPIEQPRTQRVEIDTPQAGRVEVSEPDRSRGAILREVIPELVFLAGAVYLFVMAGDFSARQQPGQLGPAFWPRLAAIGLAVGLLVRIVQVFREHQRPVVRVVSEFDDIEGEEAPVHWPSAALAMGLALGYVIATMFLGWMIATMVFLGTFAWLGGQRRWAAPVVGVAGGLVLTYLFVGVVYVAVPTGVSVFDAVTVAVYKLLGIQ
ncbi:MAG TPA: tripartite tricarboxylate transporter TctB family protein [Solirubrobacteraceae bacterium]|nr:tripartite tricarboxylate transporter TctB family protein [Solirubrobacteraceae bacterium]